MTHGGPERSTVVLAYDIFINAFGVAGQMGFASAVAWLLFLVVGLFVLVQMRMMPKSGAPLVQLADTLIGGDTERSRLFAVHLRKPTDHDVYRSGLDEAAQSHDPSLAPLLAQARGRSIPVEQIAFVSRDVAGDISSVAKLNRVDLVLMGFHKPVIGKVEVMRSYCCAALRASRFCSAAWPRRLIASSHRLPPTSAQATNAAAPAPTIPRCSCQRK